MSVPTSSCGQWNTHCQVKEFQIKAKRNDAGELYAGSQLAWSSPVPQRRPKYVENGCHDLRQRPPCKRQPEEQKLKAGKEQRETRDGWMESLRDEFPGRLPQRLEYDIERLHMLAGKGRKADTYIQRDGERGPSPKVSGPCGVMLRQCEEDAPSGEVG